MFCYTIVKQLEVEMLRQRNRINERVDVEKVTGEAIGAARMIATTKMSRGRLISWQGELVNCDFDPQLLAGEALRVICQDEASGEILLSSVRMGAFRGGQGLQSSTSKVRFHGNGAPPRWGE